MFFFVTINKQFAYPLVSRFTSGAIFKGRQKGRYFWSNRCMKIEKRVMVQAFPNYSEILNRYLHLVRGLDKIFEPNKSMMSLNKVSLKGFYMIETSVMKELKNYFYKTRMLVNSHKPMEKTMMQIEA